MDKNNNQNDVLVFDKLSDILVPLDIIGKQVKFLEGINQSPKIVSYDKNKNNTTVDNTKDYFAFPYPFIYPIRDIYNIHKEGSDNEDNIIRRVISSVRGRYVKLSAVTHRFITKFDKKEVKARVVGSLSTGTMCYVSPDKSYEFITFPSTLISSIKGMVDIYNEAEDSKWVKSMSDIDLPKSDRF